MGVVQKLRADIQVWIGVGIMVAFSAFSVHQSADAVDKAQAKAQEAQEAADKTQAALNEANKRFCDAAIPSFNVRVAMIEDINEPGQLAPGIDPESDVGKALQAQIDRNNERKADRQAERLIQNGERPEC